MNESESEANTWPFIRFGLLVTGKGEAQFLPTLFASIQQALQDHLSCHSEIVCFIGQLRPQIAPKKQAARDSRNLPSKDELLALRARAYLQQHPNSFVILIDDLEGDDPAAVFTRYRTAFDTILGPFVARAAVHFLVNMLEAYFFAHAEAVNLVLGTSLTDHDGDVETIPHPKSALKQLVDHYDEIEHAKLIVEVLDIPRVLNNPATCAALRTLFAWVWHALAFHPTSLFRLLEGTYYAVTHGQRDRLPGATRSLT